MKILKYKNPVRRIVIHLVVSTILSTLCSADLPEDPEEYAKWESGLLHVIESQKSAPPAEAIEKLSLCVRQMSHPSNLESGNRPVFRAAQSTLLAIPGHAEYYDKRIRETYNELKDPSSRKYIGSANRVQREMMRGFGILRHLPSPETAKVLGEMFAEKWQPRSCGG